MDWKERKGGRAPRELGYAASEREFTIAGYWRPMQAGEELAGEVVSVRTLQGPHGAFESWAVRTETSELFYVTQTRATVLLRYSGAAVGTHVRLAYSGMQQGSFDAHQAHTFRLFLR